MWRLALVSAAMIASAASGPLVRREGSLEEGTTRQLASLSVEDVCILMSHLDLGRYEAGIRALPVNGAMLVTADDAGLWEAGVVAGIHRKELLRRLKEFRAEGVPLELLDVDALAAKRVQSEDIGLIVRLMRAHESSAAVQEAGCWALKRLTVNEDTRVAIAAKGGIEAVVHAMAAHVSSAGVQAQGCLCLFDLAVDADNEMAIVKRGGIEAVVRAMFAHRSSAGVQEAGCAALTNLAFNAENKVAIAAKGGIEAVVGGMQAHGSSAALQEKGCWALINLAGNAKNSVEIAEKGGIEAIVRAMFAHRSSAEVQESGCWALENIVAGDSALRLKARGAGAIPFVEMALTAFPDEANLQEHRKALLEELGK
ncbi:armadillo-type protein [Baffinella frigidus]|nr:armadillo-type protein [Cryptophyta sp. CCMP2293]